MQVREVKRRAERWVRDHAATRPGFAGAFYRGSITGAADDAEHPPSSDLDMGLVFAGEVPADIGGETLAGEICFGPACWPLDRFLPLERVLGDYRLAHSFRHPFVLPGASDQLNALAAEAAREFPKPRRIAARLDDAEANCRKYIAMTRAADDEIDRVICWLWAAGITTHIILVAGLQNPTVRKRYLMARRVLAGCDGLGHYESLLALQGSQDFDRARCRAHLGQVAEIFASACRAGVPPYPFEHDICASGRAKSIGGTRELIDQGDHREAVFWLVATYARCLKVFDHCGAADQVRKYRPGLDRLLADLGIAAPDDLLARTDAVAAAIPRVRAVADEIASRAQPAASD